MRSKFPILIAIIAMTLSQWVSAETVVRVRVGQANTAHELSFDGKPFTNNISSDFLTTDIGITVSMSNGKYFELASKAGSGTDKKFWQGFSYRPEAGLSRQDLSLTLGMKNGTGRSIFMGYRSGKYDLGPPTAVLMDSIVFETTGYFLGIDYSIPVAGGRFGLSGLLAFNEGTCKCEAGITDKGKGTLGYGVGASYHYMVSPAVGISIDYSNHAYKYDFPASATTVPYSMQESTSAIGASITAQF